MAGLATTFEIDSPEFKKQVDRLARNYGLTARDLMLDQMRLWMNDLVRKTPPKSLAMGRRAVHGDIGKIFVPVMDRDVLEYWQDKFSEMAPEVFDVQLADMLQIHNRWRGRDGRVRKGPGVSRQYGVETWGKAHVSDKDYRKYLRIKQSHVGKLKAGWLPGVEKFKGKAPDFVMRQTVVKGRAADKLNKKGNGYLMAANRVPWARKKTQAMVKATGRTRERDVHRHLEKRLNGLARKA